MITTTISANISRDDRTNDRRVTGQLYGVPKGSRLSLFVGSRDIVDIETATHLSEYADDLHIDLHGSPAATSAWAKAIRNPRWTGGW